MNDKVSLEQIKEYFHSNDKETISLGMTFFIADYSDLYNYIRNKYPNKKDFDNCVYCILNCNYESMNYVKLILTSLFEFYIDNFLYDNSFIKNYLSY